MISDRIFNINDRVLVINSVDDVFVGTIRGIRFADETPDNIIYTVSTTTSDRHAYRTRDKMYILNGGYLTSEEIDLMLMGGFSFVKEVPSDTVPTMYDRYYYFEASPLEKATNVRLVVKPIRHGYKVDTLIEMSFAKPDKSGWDDITIPFSHVPQLLDILTHFTKKGEYL